MVVGMALGAAVLSGCAPTTPSGAATASPEPAAELGKVTTGPGGVQEVTLQTQDDYRFTPDHFTVHAGKVRLTVTDVGRELSHNFLFTPGTGPAAIGAQIPLITAGQKKTIDFAVTAPGDYPFECSFHADLGQVGTMTVTGG
jgi:plastocyanin